MGRGVWSINALNFTFTGCARLICIRIVLLFFSNNHSLNPLIIWFYAVLYALWLVAFSPKLYLLYTDSLQVAFAILSFAVADYID